MRFDGHMGLTRDRFAFELFGARHIAELHIKGDDWIYSLYRAGELIHRETRQPAMTDFYTPHVVEAATDQGTVALTFGFIGVLKTALEVREEGKLLWRSSTKPFTTPRTAQRVLQWVASSDETASTPEAAEQRRREEDMRSLRPAIAVDIAFGVVFFFTAREYGLVTAAVTGACLTFLLVIVDRFVKADLTGGFAVFGAVMALISAGFAVAFQDDLAVKLRGSFMGVVTAVLTLIDAANDGRYLGARFARYFAGFGRLNPRKASLAVAASAAVIVAIDTPLAFILTTDQWIWYNAFLDSLISIPIVIAAMWFARERRSPGAETDAGKA